MPRVSGTQKCDTMTAKPQTNAQVRNDPPIPQIERRVGNVWIILQWIECYKRVLEPTLIERKTVIDLRKAVMEVALPRTAP